MTRKQRTFIAWLLLLLLLAMGANYYLNLGFLPRFASLLMILPILGISVLATRYRYIPDEAERHNDKERDA
jgi:hypothetical protein